MRKHRTLLQVHTRQLTAHAKTSGERLSTISFLSSGCLSTCRKGSPIKIDNICLHSHNSDGVRAKRKLPAASCSLDPPTNESATGAFTVPDTKKSFSRRHVEVYLAHLTELTAKKNKPYATGISMRCSLRLEFVGNYGNCETNMYILFK